MDFGYTGSLSGVWAVGHRCSLGTFRMLGRRIPRMLGFPSVFGLLPTILSLE